MTTPTQETLSRLPKLNARSEYLQWSRRLHAFLRRDDPHLVGLADEPTASARESENWLKKATMAKSNIILSLGDAALAQTRTIVDVDDKTAKELWAELRRIYASTNVQAVQNLKNELDALRYKEGQDWNEHVTKFLTLVGQLATYDEELSDKDKISTLIRSLPESFAPLAMVSHLTATSIEALISAVQAEIARKKNPYNTKEKVDRDGHERIGAKANTGTLAGGSNPDQWPKRTKRGTMARRGRRIRHSKPRDISHITCYTCGRNGHKAAHCRHRHNLFNSYCGRGGPIPRGRGYPSRRGYNQGYPSPHWNTHRRGGAPQQYKWVNNLHEQEYGSFPPSPAANFGARAPDDSHNFQGWMARFQSKAARVAQEKSDDAIVDSGATHHFFHRKSLFSNYEVLANETVLVANSEARIVGKGLVNIPLNGGTVVCGYHKSEFSTHILSVAQLSIDYIVTFTKSLRPFNGCFIMCPRSKVIVFETDLKEGLWRMAMSTTATSAAANSALLTMASANRNAPPMLTWHNRLGHPSSQRQQALVNIVPSVPYYTSEVLATMTCTPCLQAKLRRAPIRSRPPRTTAPLEPIHVDISGPVLPTYVSTKYTLAILDCYTAMSKVFIFASKSAILQSLMEYKARAEVQQSAHNHKLRAIRLDGAGENRSNALMSWCATNGVDLQYSPPYASQSNDSAERLIQEHWPGHECC